MNADKGAGRDGMLYKFHVRPRGKKCMPPTLPHPRRSAFASPYVCFRASVFPRRVYDAALNADKGSGEFADGAVEGGRKSGGSFKIQPPLF